MTQIGGLGLLRRGLQLAKQLLKVHAETARPLPATAALLVCRQLELLAALRRAAAAAP